MNKPTMLQIKEKEFTQDGASKALKAEFQGKTYKKARVIPKIHQQTALNLCQKYLNSAHSCLLVEGARHFSIWISTEKTAQQNPTRNSSTVPKSRSRPRNPLQQNFELPSRPSPTIDKITAMPAELSSPVDGDAASSQAQSTSSETGFRTVIRKYRGATYAVKVYGNPQTNKKARRKYRGRAY